MRGGASPQLNLLVPVHVCRLTYREFVVSKMFPFIYAARTESNPNWVLVLTVVTTVCLLEGCALAGEAFYPGEPVDRRFGNPYSILSMIISPPEAARYFLDRTMYEGSKRFFGGITPGFVGTRGKKNQPLGGARGKHIWSSSLSEEDR